MRILALIVAVLVETLFLMHHSDPDYFGLPLELYQILRGVAVGATVLGLLAFALGFKKKRRVWLAVLLLLPTFAPTAHWIAANDTFRVQMVLARGNVRAKRLVEHLESYPQTPPQTAANWLFKKKRGRQSREVFVAKQLADFYMAVPEGLQRYIDPVTTIGLKRIEYFKPAKRLLAYHAIMQEVRHSTNEKAVELYELAGSRAIALRLKTLTAETLASLPAGLQALLRDYQAAAPAKFPVAMKLELTDVVKGGEHSLDATFHRSGWVKALAAVGVSLKPSDKPRYQLKIHRSVQPIVTSFHKGKREYRDMTLPIYTVETKLLRTSDGKELFSQRAMTARDAFRLIMTRNTSKAGFQNELFRRAAAMPINALVRAFAYPQLYGPVRGLPARKATRKAPASSPSP